MGLSMPELRYPINSLVSYHYFKKDDIGAMADGGLRLIGDSGAFSAVTQGAEIDLYAFADWAKKWKKKLAWVASLDVIGDPDGTLRNFEKLRNMDLNVVPTVHFGTKPQALDDYIKDGVDFVGLGGMVGQGGGPQLLRWIVSMFRYARDNHPQMRFHGWGMTQATTLQALPWYSADSSSYGSAWRYGQARLFDPTKGKWVIIRMNDKEAHKHRDFLERYYSVTPEEVAVANADTKHTHTVTQALGYQYFEDFLRKRFSITTPNYGVAIPCEGPSVHLVDGSKAHLSFLYKRVR